MTFNLPKKHALRIRSLYNSSNVSRIMLNAGDPGRADYLEYVSDWKNHGAKARRDLRAEYGIEIPGHKYPS